MMTSTFRVRIRGPFACFTRPEFRSEPVSYDIITPSAATGVLECILWKPEMRWVIEQIEVLSPINFISIKKNEVKVRAMTPSATDDALPSMDISDTDAVRMQRAHLMLRDVDYVVQARIEPGMANHGAFNYRKYSEMFVRRIEAGQEHRTPCLGTRELTADVSLADETTPSPIAVTRPLGMVLHSVYDDSKRTSLRDKSVINPTFFPAMMVNGVVKVPLKGLVA